MSRAMRRAWILATVVAVGAASAVATVLVLSVMRHGERIRVPGEVLTGPAAAAVGDSGIFDLQTEPRGVRHAIARADAESAAVAFAYGWEAPSYEVARESNLPSLNVPHLETRPIERRHTCERSYYVRPVVAMPDTLVVSSVTSSVVMMWSPSWVIPVCDDGGSVKATVVVADAPMALRVAVGDQPGDAPELVFPPNSFPHIGRTSPGQLDDQDRGRGLFPERAVTFATSRLASSGARVAEVPAAFSIMMSTPGPIRDSTQTSPQSPACPRWRLALDREVRLRGATSGRIVTTRTVYVARERYGCDGATTLEIPRPEQPTTLPFAYGVYAASVDSTPRMRNGRIAAHAEIEFRWAALTVTEPVWFEAARLAP